MFCKIALAEKDREWKSLRSPALDACWRFLQRCPITHAKAKVPLYQAKKKAKAQSITVIYPLARRLSFTPHSH